MVETLPLILASASTARAGLLRNAGVAVEICPAIVDEESIKASFAAEGADVLDCAMVLAEMKAVKISARNPGRLVIGADQILDLDGRWFDKPEDLAEARRPFAVRPTGWSRRRLSRLTARGFGLTMTSPRSPCGCSAIRFSIVI